MLKIGLVSRTGSKLELIAYFQDTLHSIRHVRFDSAGRFLIYTYLSYAPMWTTVSILQPWVCTYLQGPTTWTWCDVITQYINETLLFTSHTMADRCKHYT